MYHLLWFCSGPQVAQEAGEDTRDCGWEAEASGLRRAGHIVAWIELADLLMEA